MCNRFALPKPEEIAAHFELGEIPSLAPRYNVAPGESILVVRREGEARVLDTSAWGLQPARQGSPSKPVLNLRAESLRPSAAKDGPAARRTRCLVPAGGFFEWRHVGRARQPWYFRMKDAPLLGLAALCDEDAVAAGPGAATAAALRRCAIVTTQPNTLVAEVHDRMPVIIAREAYGAWLDPGVRLEELLPLLAPFPVDAMVGYPVSSVVNRAGVEDPRAVVPARQETLF
jgi:putative SOS response-associated peptidase YedK